MIKIRKDNSLSDFSLNERKRKILQAVIEEYISTAEPVGSRAISKREELGLSSATIRNEMADLEDMGYLVQPHTSAGRVPSDLGYRFYVNRLMRKYQIGMEVISRLQAELHSRINQLDRMLKNAGAAASALTEYTTFITTPVCADDIINRIELICIGIHRIMLIIVTDAVRSRTLNIDMSENECGCLSEILNARFKNDAVSELREEEILKLTDKVFAAGLDEMKFRKAAAMISETAAETSGGDIVVHNAKSILSYPEYSDVNKAKEMLGLLEDKEALKQLIGLSDREGGGSVNVRIGKENESEILNNCSLVTVSYSVDGKSTGKIGVIGPKRMNYAKVFASLDLISHEIDKLLNEFDTRGDTD